MVAVENFSANSAKSFIGRHVNLHLKDGAVIVNVQLTSIQRISGKNNVVKYTSFGSRKSSRISLRLVAWAELLHPSILQKAA